LTASAEKAHHEEESDDGGDDAATSAPAKKKGKVDTSSAATDADAKKARVEALEAELAALRGETEKSDDADA
jgi:uncharacterized protein YceH (UPF0502 family)